MGKIGGFKEYDRTDESNIVITERVSNYNEFTIPLAKDKLKNKDQGAWTVESVLP
jgi:glutamate synthase (NADPH/NADH) small chain